jgi:hypothetical protein
MQVNAVHNILGWYFGDKLRVETRTTYHYDKGNDVTVVERKLISTNVYDKNAEIVYPVERGNNVDKTI